MISNLKMLDNHSMQNLCLDPEFGSDSSCAVQFLTLGFEFDQYKICQISQNKFINVVFDHD